MQKVKHDSVGPKTVSVPGHWPLDIHHCANRGDGPPTALIALSFARRDTRMTVSEYEDRFRRPEPSWHQILTVIQSLNRTRGRRRRCFFAAALIGVATLTIEIASHYATHNHAGNGSAKKGF
jgi:hypothetical protein